jgi:tetratricopeptide (TPR) repeat protein
LPQRATIRDRHMARKRIRHGRAVPASASTPAPTAWWLHPAVVSILLISLNIVVYAAVRDFQFVNWDDPSYITENPNIVDGLTGRSVMWALTTGYSPYWHPMTWLSHLLDVQLFGMDPGPHHVTSLVIHVANTLLIFGVLRRMTAAPGRSAFVAAMFAVHPLHVESVAWVAERKDVLSTFFWTLTVAAYVAYVRRPGLPRYALVVGLFGLALMAKPMVVTLPAVLLLLDVWPLERIRLTRDQLPALGRAVLEKMPLFALAIATSIATVVVQTHVGAMASFDALAWHVRAGTAIVGYLAYLWKAIWPTRLAAFYPYRVFPAWVVVVATLTLLAATVLAFRHRNRPYLLVGWLWFVVTLSPVIGLLQAGEQAMADRFMYVPIVGLFIVVAWGVPDLVGIRRQRRWILTPAAILLIAVCTVTARAQVEHWSDSVALWEHGTRVTPDSYIAFENLGQALRERGQLEEATVNYRRALALSPAGSPAYQAVIHNSLGLVLTRQGRPADAMPEFDAAVRLNPNFAEPHSNLANALASRGAYPQAIEHYRAALRIKPTMTEALVGLGSALLSQGDTKEAAESYMAALRLDPMLAQAHNGLGAALARQGRDEEAMAQYAEALRLNPELPTAHLNIAVLLIKQGNMTEAQRHLQAALRIDPEYTPARDLLGRISM